MSDIISEKYVEILRESSKTLWHGTRAWHKVRWEILELVRDLGCESVLDWGAGEGTLCAWLAEQIPGLKTYNYDPRRPEWDTLPSAVDFVVSTDVLEHVEPEFVEATLRAMGEIAQKGQFHCICTRKAGAVLPDGRNAHLTVMPPEYWLKTQRRAQLDWLVSPWQPTLKHIVNLAAVPVDPPDRDSDSSEYRMWHRVAGGMLNTLRRN